MIQVIIIIFFIRIQVIYLIGLDLFIIRLES